MERAARSAAGESFWNELAGGHRRDPALRAHRRLSAGGAGEPGASPQGRGQVPRDPEEAMKIAIIGGGIGGLALALGLQQRGIAATVYEAAPEVKELGVGITLLPHAMREFIALGLLERLRTISIETRESRF